MNCPFCRSGDILNQAGFIKELKYTYATLDWDQRYKGRTLLILKNHYESFVDIPEEVISEATLELQFISKAIMSAFSPDKMNHMMLGNVVTHLHWHIIPRYVSDDAWGGPPIFKRNIEKLPDSEYAEMAQRIKKHIA